MIEKEKLSVALLFGGRSTEHKVSLTSVVGILSHLDPKKYNIVPIKISREGTWMLIPDTGSITSVEAAEKARGDRIIPGDPEAKGFHRIERTTSGDLHIQVDVVFPILHGTFGEDGTVQGLLSLANLPFVGAGVLASALGMDKIMMKQMFFQNDIPSVDFIWFTRKAWETSPKLIQAGIKKEIGFPCFVKPANTGSSVGVFKISEEKELQDKLVAAAQYDRKILVEKAIDARELECSVLGNDKPEASVVGEIIPSNEFYDYEAKYEDEQSQTIIPADIPDDISSQIRSLAIQAFQAIDCAGMGRVDFLFERKTNRILVNEINTIPGFTPISMYPKLWEVSGISFSELLDRLISLALERNEDVCRSRFHRKY
jgi:D-alanine-D-alanine ligase